MNVATSLEEINKDVTLVKHNAMNDTLGDSNKMYYTDHHGCFNIVYTNADCLTNKKSELLALLKSLTVFPELIIITKVNPKCMALGLETSEFNINGYNIYSLNVGKCNKMGIIIYINCKLSSTEIALVSVFSEYLFVQIKGTST